MEEPPGFEPGIAALQAAALPLGDGSVYHINITDHQINKSFSCSKPSVSVSQRDFVHLMVY